MGEGSLFAVYPNLIFGLPFERMCVFVHFYTYCDPFSIENKLKKYNNLSNSNYNSKQNPLRI